MIGKMAGEGRPNIPDILTQFVQKRRFSIDIRS